MNKWQVEGTQVLQHEGVALSENIVYAVYVNGLDRKINRSDRKIPRVLVIQYDFSR
jgi:hypothetical protein